MNPGKIQFAESEGTYLLKLLGEVRLTLCPTLEAFLDRVLNEPGFGCIIIDLSETDTIDSTSLGLLAKLSIRVNQKLGQTPILISPQGDITKILLSMGFEKVFIIVQTLKDPIPVVMKEIPCEGTSSNEQATHAQVLDAHRVLMNLSDENRQAFSELVKQLEQYGGINCDQFKKPLKKSGTG
ncbi:STAS domain-containing protein [Endozoicomonas sp. Mp262]|uniref:STAS domain-containing protein n=1 Tax=Endozoicomonas sp. Mp262 TaxID=2919499 RepID=UPI0021DADFAF